MEILEIRQELKHKNLCEIPLRVTYYARVSSKKDEQLNSLDNQKTYFENYIKNNPEWEYVEGYVDEGISGIMATKRERFQDMIRDAELGTFDFIITKELSRFARNTIDSIGYTRKLLNCGVGVFFQNDGINTFDEDSELRLTIMSGIAQDESRKLSSRVKFGHQEAIKKGVVLGNNRIFGYTKENKKLVIDEAEAKMVCELFELYATDEYSFKQIEQVLWSKGYRNHNGNRIMHNTLSNMLTNPKYKGYYVGNKVRIVDMFTKKQKFLPPEEWVMYKDETGDIVPAIVPEELWDKANEIFLRRSQDVKHRKNQCNHPNLFTGKIYCAHCNKPYYRHDSKDTKGNITSRWVCSGKIKNGADSCPSFILYEEELKPIICEIFKNSSGAASAAMKKIIEQYRASLSKNMSTGELDKINKRINFLEQKKSKLLEYNVSGKISDDDFLRMNSEIDAEYIELKQAAESLRENQLTEDEFKARIENIKKVLVQAEKDMSAGNITKDFIDTYIDKILVTPVDKFTAKLDIRLTTGKRIEKELVKTGRFFKFGSIGSTGHIFLKICPVRTLQYVREDRTGISHSKAITYIYDIVI